MQTQITTDTIYEMYRPRQDGSGSGLVAWCYANSAREARGIMRRNLSDQFRPRTGDYFARVPTGTVEHDILVGNEMASYIEDRLESVQE